MRRNKGFTLIEIMAVMAIILILLALIMPALTSARKQARKMECLSNLRQIGAAIQAYAMDSKGKFPTSQAVYDAQIPKYLDDDSIMECPENPGVDYKWDNAGNVSGKLVEVCSSNSPILQDASAVHSGNTTNILYADGHVATQ